MRNIPDVALTADNVYVIADSGVEYSVGGTSCAAPLWAGFTALVNEQAAIACESPVGFINPAIYAIGEGANYPYCFHDTKTGNNTSGSSPTKFFAVSGYDLCTGWGTPAGQNLIDALFTPTGSGPLSITVNPPSGSDLISNTNQTIFVTIYHVTNATVTASIAGITNLTFLNNGLLQDAVANDDIYSASFQVPASATSLAMTVAAVAPGRIANTNIFYYNVIPLPSNDNFASAIKVPAGGAIYLSNNRFATLESGEPQHDGDSYAVASLWWAWTPVNNTNMFIDTSGSKVDTVLAVYTGSSLTNLQQVVATNSSLAQHQPAYLSFNAQAGTAYYIAVAGADANSLGSIQMRMSPGGQPDTAPPQVSITNLLNGLTVSNQLISVAGTASDPSPSAAGLSEVLMYINGCIPATVSGTTNWSAPVLLQPGLNTILVTAIDGAGNFSSPVTMEIDYLVLNPPNDFFALAIPLAGANGTVTGTNVNATKEAGEPNHAGNTGGKSVWWSFQPSADGVLTLSTTNSTFDTLLAMYVGSPGHQPDHHRER